MVAQKGKIAHITYDFAPVTHFSALSYGRSRIQGFSAWSVQIFVRNICDETQRR